MDHLLSSNSPLSYYSVNPSHAHYISPNMKISILSHYSSLTLLNLIHLIPTKILFPITTTTITIIPMKSIMNRTLYVFYLLLSSHTQILSNYILLIPSLSPTVLSMYISSKLMIINQILH